MNIYEAFLKLCFPLWVAGTLLAVQIGNFAIQMDHGPLTDRSEISYVESLEEVDNPGRGFYVPVYVHYEQEENQEVEFWNDFLHLRLDLSEFSGAYNKKGDAVLSEDMLQAFDKLLSEVEEKQCSVIIRFSYDPGFSGKKAYEPSMEMILKHQEQLGEIISRHEKAVTVVECGLFGKWGEMHGSDACMQENFNQAIDQWMKVLPESIPVSVRTIAQYCGYVGISAGELPGREVTPEDKDYRLGLFDDGYLASNTDLGTFANREAEVAWFYAQKKHVTFGGELGLPYDTAMTPTAAYMEKEAYLTHVTYLNSNWNESVISGLKDEIFNGENARYQGQSGYLYVKNHLGYRYVVRGVRMNREVQQTKRLILEVDVENVGFANLTKPKDVTLFLVSEEATYQYTLEADAAGGVTARNTDPRSWDSNAITTLRASVPFTEDMPQGKYQAYLRIASPSGDGGEGKTEYPIRFANEGMSAWEKDPEAYFLGTFRVTEKPVKLKWSIEDGIQFR